MSSSPEAHPDLISIIIPVKDRPEELERALRSVQTQTHGNWEALVVDDHSEVDIEAVVQAFDDPRMKYIRNASGKKNANVCRNMGLGQAQGAYTAMLDSDDAWKPGHLSSRLAHIKQCGADGLYGGAVINDGSKEQPASGREQLKEETFADYLLSFQSQAYTPSHFYKTSCAQAVGWDEELWRHQDYDFSIRFAKAFEFQKCHEETVIVYWARGEGRTVHVDSYIRFLEKHMADISPKNRARYALTQLSKHLEENHLDDKQKGYFEQLLKKNFRTVSLADYAQIRPHDSLVSKVKLRADYYLRKLG